MTWDWTGVRDNKSYKYSVLSLDQYMSDFGDPSMCQNHFEGDISIGVRRDYSKMSMFRAITIPGQD